MLSALQSPQNAQVTGLCGVCLPFHELRSHFRGETLLYPPTLGEPRVFSTYMEYNQLPGLPSDPEMPQFQTMGFEGKKLKFNVIGF